MNTSYLLKMNVYFDITKEGKLGNLPVTQNDQFV